MRRALLWWFLRRSTSLRRIKRSVKRRLVERPRRVPHKIGVAGLFEALNERGCRYVVLRWFDDLPEVDEAGDLDILIDDDDAAVLDRMLTRSSRSGGIQCDVYSVHGLPSFAYRRFAYYPPAVAEQLLERAVRHHSGAYVPCPQDHFFSLAFHALYHKGYGSGLPVSDTVGPRGHDLRHDYAKVLESIARAVDISVPINMEALDHELDIRGWRPPPDTLLKWAVRNPWCKVVVNRIFKHVPTPPGLMLCLVREMASDSGTIAEIERMMDNWGFTRLLTRSLDQTQKERASRMVRGGNWGRGTWPRSGGGPSVMIAAVDPSPSSPSQQLLLRHPGVDNGRVFEFKKQVRDWFNQQRADRQRCNIMHTSDNAAHAVHYLQIIMPEGVDAIFARERDSEHSRSTSGVT